MIEVGLLCLGVLTAGYLLLILLYARGWRKLVSPIQASMPPLGLSIIIPARNESTNIVACLKSLLAQDYPAHLLDIIVVDDGSEDDTIAKTRSMALPQVRVLRSEDAGEIPPGFVAFKKRALAWGIQHAQYEHLITVDADCTFQPHWAKQISAGWQQQTNANLLVLPVKINWTPQSFLTIFQALDFLSLQAITAAAHGLGIHGMCNGANLSFRKSAFEAVGGYLGIDHRASGDDMLLLQKIDKTFPSSVYYLKDADTIASTTAAESWWNFLQQRIRWASKADVFQEWQIKAVLVWVYATNLGLLGGLLAGLYHSLANGDHLIITTTAVAYGTKTTVEYLFLLPVAHFMGEGKLLRYFPFAQLPHSVYMVFAGTLSWFKQYEWKGRKLH